MDTYNPEVWRDFFAMTGGAAATLAGLVFVAMSLNVRLIAKDSTHRNRAVRTLSGFVAGFLMCGFGLLGQQTYVTLGVGRLVISITTLFIYMNGIIQARRNSTTLVGGSLRRVATGTGL